MDKILEITLLYDFYGELLTTRQKEIFEMYYEDDLSLSEIGEQLSISRQAVRDSLRHSKETLTEYESKLCLVSKFVTQQKILIKIKDIINKMENECLTDNTINYINQLKNITDEILE